jgi:uncharacterized delta-60 repeat protein
MAAQRRIFGVGAAACAVLAAGGLAWAAGGDLDPSYGSGGVSVTSSTESATNGAMQSGGRMVVLVGQTGATPPWRLVRYDASGALDGTFGSGGSATAFTASDAPQMTGVGLDGDSIVVAGRVTQTGRGKSSTVVAAVVRFTANGALDGTFGSGGKAFVSVSGALSTTAFAVAVQPDHKVLVVGDATWKSGKTTQDGWFVARLNANGSLDSGFGSGGIALLDPTTQTDEIWRRGAACLPDGSVAIGGYTPETTGMIGLGTTTTVAVLGPTGLLKATTTFASSAYPSLDVDAAGRLLVGRRHMTAASVSVTAITRHTWDGTTLALDGSFGASGETALAVAGAQRFVSFSGLEFSSTGEILGAGVTSSNGVNAGLAYAFRLTSDGILDGTFGSGGMAGPLSPRAYTLPQAAGVDSQDRLVIAGMAYDSGSPANPAWFAARYLPQ